MTGDGGIIKLVAARPVEKCWLVVARPGDGSERLVGVQLRPGGPPVQLVTTDEDRVDWMREQARKAHAADGSEINLIELSGRRVLETWRKGLVHGPKKTGD